jgi:hypothetical protein
MGVWRAKPPAEKLFLGQHHGASARTIMVSNQNARTRTQRILFHQAGSGAEKWRGDKPLIGKD